MSTSSMDSEVGKRIDYYVRCKAEPGMFRGELLVHLEELTSLAPLTSRPIELLVDAELMILDEPTPSRQRPIGGLLKISLLEKRDGFAAIVLPQPTIATGGTTIIVRAEDLVDVPAGTQ